MYVYSYVYAYVYVYVYALIYTNANVYMYVYMYPVHKNACTYKLPVNKDHVSVNAAELLGDSALQYDVSIHKSTVLRHCRLQL